MVQESSLAVAVVLVVLEMMLDIHHEMEEAYDNQKSWVLKDEEEKL